MNERITVRVVLDPVQAAWLEALAELHETTRPAVLREALLYLSSREADRLSRNQRIAAIARAYREYPINDYLERGRSNGYARPLRAVALGAAVDEPIAVAIERLRRTG